MERGLKPEWDIVDAHRLASVATTDARLKRERTARSRILDLVFSHGRIVEDGSHAELLALRAACHALSSRQTDGLLPDEAAAQ